MCLSSLQVRFAHVSQPRRGLTPAQLPDALHVLLDLHDSFCSTPKDLVLARLLLEYNEEAGQFAASTVVELLENAIGRAEDRAIAYMLQLIPKVQQLDVATTARLLEGALEAEEGAQLIVRDICSYVQAAKQLDVPMLSTLLTKAAASKARIPFCTLLALPAASQITSDTVGSLLATLTKSGHHYEIQALCRLPAAARVSSATVISLLDEALKLRQHSLLLSTLCELPGAGSIATVSLLIKLHFMICHSNK